MIGTIRRHSTWLWIVIIIVTIFTFVYWGSSRYDRGGSGRENYGSIDGERITRDEFAAAQREAYLRYFLAYGSWPDSEGKRAAFDPEREVYQWLFFLKKLRDNDVHVDNRSAARAVNEVLSEFGRANSAEGGPGTPIPFEVFVQRLLVPHGISANDFERFVRHDLAIQQLVSVVGLSGRLVTPQEAEYLYQRDYQEFLTEAVFFSASNYLDHVTNVTPAGVMQFYTNEMSAYHIPERVQVSYVAFAISNHLGEAEKELTNLTVSVDDTLRRLGTNYARLGKTPEEAKARIRAEFIRRQALGDATKQANEFANDLFGMEPEQAGNLAALAKTNGLTVHLTKPFDAEYGPSELDGGPNFAKAAFLLSADKPFAEQPLAGEDAVYVIAFDKRFPDEVPPLNEIHDRVAADYNYRQAVLLARRAGEEFVHAATNGLARGETPAAVCADARVGLVSVPPFSFNTSELPEVENQVDLNQFKQVAAGTPPHTFSELSPTRNGGFVVYVRARVPVDTARMKAGLPAFLNLLRRARQQEALNLWLTKEGSISLRNTPLAQRGQSSAGAAGRARP